MQSDMFEYNSFVLISVCTPRLLYVGLELAGQDDLVFVCVTEGKAC